MGVVGSTMPTYRDGLCEHKDCGAFPVGPRQDGLLTCSKDGGTDFFVRYAELLRRAWLNPSFEPWQLDVYTFEREYGDVLKLCFSTWRANATSGTCGDRPSTPPPLLPHDRREFARAVLIAQANMLRTMKGLMEQPTAEFTRHHEILLTSRRQALAALDAGQDVEVDGPGGVLTSALR